MSVSNLNDYDFMFKIILIGDAGVGKSSCMTRFTRNEFNIENQQTLIVDFDNREILVDGRTIRLQIWDTTGQERFRSVTMSYYRGAVGALVFYDLTRRVSFKNVDFWLREVRVLGAEEIVIILVGNKTDLCEQRTVTTEEGEILADQRRIGFIETSAKDSINVEQTFYFLTKEICKKHLLNLVPKRSVIRVENRHKNKKKCCK